MPLTIGMNVKVACGSSFSGLPGKVVYNDGSDDMPYQVELLLVDGRYYETWFDENELEVVE